MILERKHRDDINCFVRKERSVQNGKKQEYETFEEAKMAIFEFIEGWYNRKRIHSAIGYKIPYQLEGNVA